MNWRKLHRIVALIIVVPLSVTILTGLVLLMRNQIEWIQPKTVGTQEVVDTPMLAWESLVNRPEGDVEQIIYRPKKHNISIRLTDGRELQVHPQTGETLKLANRNTNWIIRLHEGSWLGTFGQNFIHLIAGLGLAFLVISGFIIWPFWKGKNL